MRLRVARKICKAVGGSRERAYSSVQIRRAIAIVDRLPTSRENRRFWYWLMEQVPPLMKAEAAIRIDRPDLAFYHLTRDVAKYLEE